MPGYYCDCPNKVRVVALLDVDSFEVQVRGRDAGISPEKLQTEPFAVKSNLITSVNQPAKEYGIVRGPEDPKDWRQRQRVNVLQTPYIYGKPENLRTREAGDDIYDCIISTLDHIARRQFCENCELELIRPIVEKENCDEYFLDLTDEVHQRLEDLFTNTNDYSLLSNGNRNFSLELRNGAIEKYNLNLMSFLQRKNTPEAKEANALVEGSKIVAQILDEVYNNLGFFVSAGIGKNKLMAKLACHISKPNGLTILPSMSLDRIVNERPFTNIPGLGGSVGEKIKEKWPNVETIGDIRKAFSSLNFRKWFERKNVRIKVIYERLYGIDNTPVVNKHLPHKVTCGMTLNTYANNRASTRNDFVYHLHNRFHEMRDQILYDFDRHGRTPNRLKLEIFQKSRCASGKSIVFREELQFPGFMIEKFKDWKQIHDYDYDPMIAQSLKEWKPLLGEFKSQINKYSAIPLFSSDGACISSLCRINLIAYFCNK